MSPIYDALGVTVGVLATALTVVLGVAIIVYLVRVALQPRKTD